MAGEARRQAARRTPGPWLPSQRRVEVFEKLLQMAGPGLLQAVQVDQARAGLGAGVGGGGDLPSELRQPPLGGEPWTARRLVAPPGRFVFGNHGPSGHGGTARGLTPHHRENGRAIAP